MDDLTRWLVGIPSVGLFVFMMIAFWLYGYKNLKRRGLTKNANIQLWLGPFFGFFTGVFLFQQSIFTRRINPLNHEPKKTIDSITPPAHQFDSLLTFLKQNEFQKIHPEEYTQKQFADPNLINIVRVRREIRHLVFVYKEHYQFMNWKDTGEDPLVVIQKHQEWRTWVNQQIRIPRVLRKTIPVILTVLVVDTDLGESEKSWLIDELIAVSKQDWLGGEVHSMLLLNRALGKVESIKMHKQGDTIGINSALDLFQEFLNQG